MIGELLRVECREGSVMPYICSLAPAGGTTVLWRPRSLRPLKDNPLSSHQPCLFHPIPQLNWHLLSARSERSTLPMLSHLGSTITLWDKYCHYSYFIDEDCEKQSWGNHRIRGKTRLEPMVLLASDCAIQRRVFSLSLAQRFIVYIVSPPLVLMPVL